MSKPSLILYHYWSCPFCMKVHNYLKTRGITIPLKNTREDPEADQALFSLTGRHTVPCLVINGHPLFESDDIIAWFEDNYE